MGLSNTSQIEDIFFREILSTMLSNNKTTTMFRKFNSSVNYFSKILAQLTQHSFGIKLDKSDIPGFTEEIKKKILIFDDLERCQIPIKEVMGWINTYVEHNGQRVIILADESKIKKGTVYKNIKEKLIGQTFEINACGEKAFDNFVSFLEMGDAQKTIKKEKETVLKIFHLFGENNLRLLKKALFDFERFYKLIPENFKKNDDFVVYILRELLVLSISIGLNKIQPENISKDALLDIIKEGGDEFDDNQKSYFSTLEYIIPSSICWQDFFEKGLVRDSKTMTDSIQNSSFFYEEAKREDWVKLWHYIELQDSEFENLRASVWNQFKKNKYTSPGIIKHIIGIFLKLSQIGLFNESQDYIVSTAGEVIKFLERDNSLEIDSEEHRTISVNMPTYGLGYMKRDTEEFKEIHELLLSAQDNVEMNTIKSNAKTELLKLLKEDPGSFACAITDSFRTDSEYKDKPVFQEDIICTDSFLKTMIDFEPQLQLYIAGSFQSRYTLYREGLQIEINWISEIIKKLSEIENKNSGTVSGVRINAIKKIFEKCRSILDPTQTSEENLQHQNSDNKKYHS